ncbi:hypothetical protein GUITHDRAFT_100642 [Guillardia theta CCMP2712]|uniref:Uncharacterized protein n=1 Tax=Guillardia theta (strain CCMP2712) TaxID=905079 RepID=L1JZC7_GUITC|nr:hypothetical protein GUITHDRAFT_100642 [Guillardia theta CCMP2712]EKX53664.1 hypothetical protein GUITHDRAFT_100642 [Guillardia theta CCMP2712]|eukprot:XP_005840644.1 hypothetical protein GUITHDRAFT_100642 [Guillardia theta CCMP2712]
MQVLRLISIAVGMAYLSPSEAFMAAPHLHLTRPRPSASTCPVSPVHLQRSCRARPVPMVMSAEAVPIKDEQVEKINLSFMQGLKMLEDGKSIQDSLSGFVSNVADMYEIGTSLSNLETNLQEHASNQEVQGKRQELRSRLLSIIYLASETAGYPRKQQAELGIPDDFRSSYSNFVRNLVVLRKNGGTLQVSVVLKHL